MNDKKCGVCICRCWNEQNRANRAKFYQSPGHVKLKLRRPQLRERAPINFLIASTPSPPPMSHSDRNIVFFKGIVTHISMNGAQEEVHVRKPITSAREAVNNFQLGEAEEMDFEIAR